MTSAAPAAVVLPAHGTVTIASSNLARVSMLNGGIPTGLGVTEKKSKEESMRHAIPTSIVIGTGNVFEAPFWPHLDTHIAKMQASGTPLPGRSEDWAEALVAASAMDALQETANLMGGIATVEQQANLHSVVHRVVSRTVFQYTGAGGAKQLLDEDVAVQMGKGSALVALFEAAAACAPIPTTAIPAIMVEAMAQIAPGLTLALMAKLQWFAKGHHVMQFAIASPNAVWKLVTRLAAASPGSIWDKILKSGDPTGALWIYVHGYDSRWAVSCFMSIDAARYLPTSVRPLVGEEFIVGGVSNSAVKIGPFNPNVVISNELSVRWVCMPEGSAILKTLYEECEKMSGDGIIFLMPSAPMALQACANYKRILSDPVRYSSACAFLSGTGRTTVNMSMYDQACIDVVRYMQCANVSATMRQCALFSKFHTGTPSRSWDTFLSAWSKAPEVALAAKQTVDAVVAEMAKHASIVPSTVKLDAGSLKGLFAIDMGTECEAVLHAALNG